MSNTDAANGSIGVCLEEGRCQFLVWAPRAKEVAVHLLAPRERIVPLTRAERGYHYAVVKEVEPGSRYFYRLDGGKERPDPASRYQPEGVHGPSQVINTQTFSWSDHGWRGITAEEMLLYELHVGTFTPEGTFAAVIPHLARLRELGITAIELMPVAQFPGHRNWGYDGVYPFAAQNSYGGPQELQILVDACHRHGLAIILDVVYNHLGPEGNYLADFGPYFTDRYRPSWGPALNFDGPGSDEVRRFFLKNALYWVTDFHFDGLRLDAIHAILDFSARPFLAELAEAVHVEGKRLGRNLLVIAESDLNDSKVIRPPARGGYGLDAQWNDDFHHALHVLLTGERQGYYQDFGRLEDLARAFREGYVYTGQYSTYRDRRHGNSPQGLPSRRFIVFSQNHDQVGNRARGERLSSLTSFAGLKLAACAVLLAPFVPLIFMGEEYGETAPFQYFTSYPDPELAEAVRQGRQREFAAFAWAGKIPDPQDERTFTSSRLRPELAGTGPHRILYQLYRRLIRLRRELPALANPDQGPVEVTAREEEQLLLLQRGRGTSQVFALFHFGQEEKTVCLRLPAGVWHLVLDTSEEQWGGPGRTVPVTLISPGEVPLCLSPQTCVLWQLMKEETR